MPALSFINAITDGDVIIPIAVCSTGNNPQRQKALRIGSKCISRSIQFIKKLNAAEQYRNGFDETSERRRVYGNSFRAIEEPASPLKESNGLPCHKTVFPQKRKQK